MMKKSSIAFLIILLLSGTLMVIFVRPIYYFGNIQKFTVLELTSSKGVEVSIPSSSELLALLENHPVRRSLNLSRIATSIVPSNDYILITFISNENTLKKTIVIDLELLSAVIPSNANSFIDYHFVEPSRFIEEFLNL